MLFKPMILLVVLVFSFAGCDQEKAKDTNDPDLAQQASTPPKTHATYTDQTVIDEMTPQHEMGLMMSDDALSKASHAETKNFARRFKTVQTADIQQLKARKRGPVPQIRPYR